MTPPNRRVGPAQLPADVDPRPARTKQELRSALSAAAAPSIARPGRWLAVLRTVVGALFVVGASIGVGLSVRRYVMSNPRFAIVSIDVSGNDRRPPDAVASESGLAVGTNVFAADLDVARAKLLSDPWIVGATLVRRLPGTISIRVVERQPAALVVLDDTYLATADGVAFKKLEPGDPIDLPVITGVTPESVATDRVAAARTIAAAIDLAAESERSDLGKRAPLQEVHVGADGTFSLIVGHGGVQLSLGGPPFRRKIDQAARVLGELERRGAKADAVMLDNDARPERVVVRMR